MVLKALQLEVHIEKGCQNILSCYCEADLRLCFRLRILLVFLCSGTFVIFNLIVQDFVPFIPILQSANLGFANKPRIVNNDCCLHKFNKRKASP